MGSQFAAPSGWKQLDVAVIGGGIGGLCTAIALRRSGHKVTIYERADFAGEKGASVSCAANGTRWLEEWGVDVQKGDPVHLKKLISRDWYTGEPYSVYDCEDYHVKWGYVYWMFHRQYMHAMLKDTALQEEGEGIPAKMLVNHKCKNIDLENGTVEFDNGVTVTHDLIVGADGIGSAVRGVVGIHPEKRPAPSSCLHANVMTEDAVRLGLTDYSADNALEYWGGQEGKFDKIVLSPCNGGKLLSYYCFFPREKGDYTSQAWGSEDLPVEDLLAPYPELDKRVRDHLAIGIEVQPWRLWIHDPYPYMNKKRVAILGDAAHPMMPHQSQGACMAIEDAAALGIVFSKKYFNGNVEAALQVYSDVRLPRASKVQAAAAKAAYNINERIGFSSNTDVEGYNVEDESAKLTIEEMNGYDMYRDIEEKIAKRDGVPFNQKFITGLPVGLKLSNGVTVGQQ